MARDDRYPDDPVRKLKLKSTESIIPGTDDSPRCSHPTSMLPSFLQILCGQSCPRCVVVHHILRIKDVQRGLEARGGVFASKAMGVVAVEGKTHAELKSQWRKAKVALLNDIARFEGALGCRRGMTGVWELPQGWGVLEEAIKLFQEEVVELGCVPGVEMTPRRVEGDEEEDGMAMAMHVDEDSKRISERMMTELRAGLQVVIREVDMEMAEEENQAAIHSSASFFYIARALDPKNSIEGISAAEVEVRATEIIQFYAERGMQDSIDWPRYPLPQQLIAVERSIEIPKPAPCVPMVEELEDDKEEENEAETVANRMIVELKEILHVLLKDVDEELADAVYSTPSYLSLSKPISKPNPRSPNSMRTSSPFTTPRSPSVTSPRSILRRKTKVDTTNSASQRRVTISDSVLIPLARNLSQPPSPSTTSKPHNKHTYATSRRRRNQFKRTNPAYMPRSWASPWGYEKVNTSYFKVSWEGVEKVWDKREVDSGEKDRAVQDEDMEHPIKEDLKRAAKEAREKAARETLDKPIKEAPEKSYKEKQEQLKSKLRVIGLVWVLMWVLKGVGKCVRLGWLGEALKTKTNTAS